MPIITSPLGKLTVVPKRPQGLQFAKPPAWKQVSHQPLKVTAGRKNTLDFTEYIENAATNATYSVKIYKEVNYTMIEDCQLLDDVVDMPDKQRPIVIINPSKIDVVFHLKLIYEYPNGCDTEPSLLIAVRIK